MAMVRIVSSFTA